MAEPRLTILVACFDMQREIPRTLATLRAGRQTGVEEDDYEVLVIDNGSTPPLDASAVASFGSNFRTYHVPDPSPSPVRAMNEAATTCETANIGLLFDGARMLSPGTVGQVLGVLESDPDAVVGMSAFHLGPKAQQDSVLDGYDREVEDRLLDSVDWMSDPYRLFEISSLSRGTRDGCFANHTESNPLFLSRSAFDALGGFDEAFDARGGGFANLDFYKRACERPSAHLVFLLGEASFHQFHGGIAANRSDEEVGPDHQMWARQYEELRGRPLAPPVVHTTYLGTVHEHVLPFIAESAARLSSDMDRARLARRLAEACPDVFAAAADLQQERAARESVQADLDGLRDELARSRGWRALTRLRQVRNRIRK